MSDQQKKKSHKKEATKMIAPKATRTGVRIYLHARTVYHVTPVFFNLSEVEKKEESYDKNNKIIGRTY